MKKPLALLPLIILVAALAVLTSTPSPAEAQSTLSAPDNFLVTVTSSSSVGLSWNRPPNTPAGDIYYQYAHKQDTATDWTEGTAFSSNSSFFDRTITALGTDTTYNFRVRACRSSALDGCSSYVMGTATPTDKPSAPALTGSAAGNQAVRVMWGGIQRISDGDTIRIEYKLSTAADWSVASHITVDHPASQADVTGLNQNDAYDFRVRATNSHGDGAWSNIVIVAGQPGAPTNVTYITTDSTSVLLSWDPPGNTGGAVLTGYTYEHSSDEGVNWDVAGTTADTSAPIGGLTSGVDYLFRVRAENADRNGPWSANATLVHIYDLDGDGLIDIVDLAQLDAIRWDPNGDGVADDSDDATAYTAAFPSPAAGMGCADTDADNQPGPCAGYELATDLDFDTGVTGDRSDDDYYNGGAGWLPIGAYSSVFDGNGRTIANLHIDRPGDSGLGLFASIGGGGVVRDLGLTGVDVNGGRRVGGLAGVSRGTINGSWVVGTVRGSLSNTGGLVGQHDGIIINSFALGEVHGDSQVGGLVGSNTRAGRGVTGSYSAGTVSGRLDVGGLVGHNNDRITRSFAAGTVNGVADSVDMRRSTQIGGLVGQNGGIGSEDEGTIIASYATASVSGHTRVGGLVGVNLNTGRIIASYAAGTVQGLDSDSVEIGGLYGASNIGSRDFRGEITASYHDRDISGFADDHGRSTESLTGITGYSGIFAGWNRDLDGDSTNDDPWDFGANGQYPVLKVDWNDADAIATWQEFGYQTRLPLPLTVTRNDPEALLSWPDITEAGWIGSPAATYALYRDGEELTGYGGQSRSHTDTGLTVGQNHVYQVALLLDGVEFRRSREVSTEAATMTTDPSPLTERTLNGARLTVDLARTEYVADLLTEHFELPATAGLSIARVNRVSNTRATLTLAFGGNFESEVPLTVTVGGDANTSGATLTTNAVTVTPAPVPDQVTGVNAAGGSVSLDVTWDAADNADGYVVQWRLAGEPLYEDSVSVPSGFTTRTTLSHLLAETAYDVQVYATSNYAGDGPPSVTVTAETLAFAPPPPPADAIILHTVPCPLGEANLDGATITLALLERANLAWQSVLHLDHFTASGVPGVSVTGVARLSDEQVALVLAYDDTDFDEDATLLIRIDRPALHFGGPISATTTIEAVVETSPGQVTGVRVTPGPRRITVNWDTVPDAHGYKVQWQRQGQDWHTDRREVSGRQRTLEGLRPGTDYTVRVVATRDKAPYGAPSEAVVTATPAFRVRLAGTDPSPLTEYNLNEATVSIDLEGAEWVLQLHGPRLVLDPNLIRPQGLPVWVEYVERVSASRLKVTLGYRGGDIDQDATLTLALDEGTNGWAGATVQVPVNATNEAAPSDVTTVRATGGDKEVSVRWDPVVGATGYSLEWIGPDDTFDDYRQDRRRVITEHTSHVIRKSLEAGTAYTVRVAAFIPRIGYGDWSDPVTATTNSATAPQQQPEPMPQPAMRAGVTVDPTRVTLPEGWTGSYSLVLDAQPDGDVTITMSSDNPDVAPYPNPIIFTPDNWQTKQLIGVPAAEDGDAVDDTAVISHTVSGGGYDGMTVASVTVTITDEDTGGITVSATSLNVREGEEATYRVSLSAQPRDEVSIFLAGHNISGSAGVTVEPDSVTFTPDNWQPRTVTVRADEDDDTTDGEVVIAHSVLTTPGSGYDGIEVDHVTVRVTDDDTTLEILRDFYDGADGANWTDNANWLSNRPLEEWHGITVNEDGQVTELVLDGNNLAGDLPPEIGKLESLTRLALNRNGLTGAVPLELGSLPNLSILGLARNSLSGPLPAELGDLSTLTKLSLHDNTELSGPLPSGFTGLTNLERLAIANTGLCAPADAAFTAWLAGVSDKPGGVPTCQ